MLLRIRRVRLFDYFPSNVRKFDCRLSRCGGTIIPISSPVPGRLLDATRDAVQRRQTVRDKYYFLSDARKKTAYAERPSKKQLTSVSHTFRAYTSE